MGNTFGPKGFSRVSQIIIHKADQPDIVVNFFDADGLTGEDGTEVDLFVAQIDPAAIGDDDGFVVKGMVDFEGGKEPNWLSCDRAAEFEVIRDSFGTGLMFFQLKAVSRDSCR